MQLKIQKTFKLEIRVKVPECSSNYDRLFHTYDAYECKLDVMFRSARTYTDYTYSEKEMTEVVDVVLKKFKTPIEIEEAEIKTIAFSIFEYIKERTHFTVEKIILYKNKNICYIVEH